MNWLSFVKMFSGPIGSFVQSAVTAGAATATGYLVGTGKVAPTDATAIVTAGVTILGTLVNMLTGTQMIAVSNIRSDPTNGITVVPAQAAKKAGIAPVADPANPAKVFIG